MFGDVEHIPFAARSLEGRGGRVKLLSGLRSRVCVCVARNNVNTSKIVMRLFREKYQQQCDKQIHSKSFPRVEVYYSIPS